MPIDLITIKRLKTPYVVKIWDSYWLFWQEISNLLNELLKL